MAWHPLSIRFFVHSFVSGFCASPPLVIFIVVVLMILSNQLGNGVGLPRLFWHEDRVKQFCVGIGVFAFLSKVLFVGYILETRRDRPFYTLSGSNLGGGHWANLCIYLVGVAIPIGTFGTGLWLLQRFSREPDGDTSDRFADFFPSSHEWPMALGIGIGGFAFFVALYLIYRVPTVKKSCDRWGRVVFFFRNAIGGKLAEIFLGDRKLGELHPPDDEYYLHGMATVSVMFGLIIYFAIYVLQYQFSPALAFLFLFNVTIAGYGFVSYHSRRSLPYLALAVAGLVIAGGVSRYKVRFEGVDYSTPRPLTASAAPKFLLASNEVDFTPDRRKRPLIIVCVSGGASRSAVWTMTVLKALEEEFQKHDVAFPYHVRLMTGASGGMVGSAYYAATVPPPEDRANRKLNRPAGELDRMIRSLEEDALSRVVYRMAYNDVFSFGSPIPTRYDRGNVLEDVWAETLDGQLEQPFNSLREGEKAGWRPSLVFSPMLVEDGRQLYISNLDLQEAAQSRGNIMGQDDDVMSRKAVEFFRIFPEADSTFKVATAVRMSASFPYVSPAAILPTQPRRRVVDAGYYDNYGVGVATSWLFANQKWIEKHASGVVLIQIRAWASGKSGRLESIEDPNPSILARGIEGLTSPVEGVASMRVAAAAFRNNERLALLSETFNLRSDFAIAAEPKNRMNYKSAADQMRVRSETLKSPFFTTVAFEFDGNVSLSWYLTQSEKARLEKAGKALTAPKAAESNAVDLANNRALKELIKWWKARPQSTVDP
jgi:predicted acylesterase/phospholipase RssA